MLFRLAECYEAIDEVVDPNEKKYFRIDGAWISHTYTYLNPPGFWYSVYDFAEPPSDAVVPH